MEIVAVMTVTMVMVVVVERVMAVTIAEVCTQLCMSSFLSFVFHKYTLKYFEKFANFNH